MHPNTPALHKLITVDLAGEPETARVPVTLEPDGEIRIGRMHRMREHPLTVRLTGDGGVRIVFSTALRNAGGGSGHAERAEFDMARGDPELVADLVFNYVVCLRDFVASAKGMQGQVRASEIVDLQASWRKLGGEGSEMMRLMATAIVGPQSFARKWQPGQEQERIRLIDRAIIRDVRLTFDPG